METAEHMCGMSKGPCRHKETWWTEEVAVAVREKKTKVQKMENRKLKGGMDSIRRVGRVQRGLLPRQRKRTDGMCK